jgi:hypothetical protein
MTMTQSHGIDSFVRELVCVGAYGVRLKVITWITDKKARKKKPPLTNKRAFCGGPSSKDLRAVVSPGRGY